MKSLDDAHKLAKCMVGIGKSLNRKTIAVITNMNQPLGHEVGNANEIREVIEVLKGQGAEDETAVALTLATYMAIASGKYTNFDATYAELVKVIESGTAIAKLKELIAVQGGNPQIVDEPRRLAQARYHLEIPSKAEGYIRFIDAEQIGLTAMILGAGRKEKGDQIDHAAGVTLLKKVGEYVKLNEPLCILHTNLEDVHTQVIDAFVLQKEKPGPLEYIHGIIT
jgi:thymidine phosphorylase